jgi:LmbE family N-acetylglucosaminyl deacetylase
VRRIAVVEPHMDDAALAAGGRILMLRGLAEVTIVSATRASDHVRRAARGESPQSVDEVTRLRLSESTRAAAALGARQVSIDEPDAPLRFAAKAGQALAPRARERAVRAWSAFGPSDAEVAALAARLGEALVPLAPEEVWIPLGVGANVDHWRTRDACLELLASEPRLAAARVLAYEDVPYAVRSPEHAARLGALLEGSRLIEDVSSVLEEKVRVLGVYSSQLGREDALEHARVSVRETAWEISAATRPPPRFAASPRWRAVEALRPALRGWLQDREHVRELAVVALGAAGRIEDSAPVLARAFPEARVVAASVPRTLLRPGAHAILAGRGARVLAALLLLRPRIATRFLADACLALEAELTSSALKQRASQP